VSGDRAASPGDADLDLSGLFSMRARFPRQRSRNDGFTFLEIILVVLIIGILASIVGPRLVGRSKKARIGATQSQMAAIRTALQTFEIEVGRFPSTGEGLQALVVRPNDVEENDWNQYMEKLPVDGWGEPFIYRYPGEHGLDYDLLSKGPDRSEGTDDDITNWEGVERGRL